MKKSSRFILKATVAIGAIMLTLTPILVLAQSSAFQFAEEKLQKDAVEVQMGGAITKNYVLKNMDEKKALSFQIKASKASSSASDTQQTMPMPLEWISFSQGAEYTVDPLKATVVPTIVTVPANAAEGIYKIRLTGLLVKSPTDAVIAGSGASMSLGIGNVLKISVVKPAPTATEGAIAATSISTILYYGIVALLLIIIIMLIIRMVKQNKDKKLS